MDRTSHQLLARPGLADDHHREVRGRNPRDLLDERRDLDAATHHLEKRKPRLQRFLLRAASRQLPRRLPDDGEDFPLTARLGQVPERAFLDPLHRVLDAAVAGQDDHRQVRADAAGAAQDLRAVEVGEPYVQQHEVRGLAPDCGQGANTVGRLERGHAVQLEHLL
jgi:hypothetical protein